MTTNPPDETPSVPEDDREVTPAIGRRRPPTEPARTRNLGGTTRLVLLTLIFGSLVLLALVSPGAYSVVNGDPAGAEAWAGVLDAASRLVGSVADLVRAARGEPPA